MSAEIEYELNKYDEYMTRVQTLLEFGLASEAKAYETLADLCYEKIAMLTRLEKFTEFMKRRQKADSAAPPPAF